MGGNEIRSYGSGKPLREQLAWVAAGVDFGFDPSASHRPAVL
jgi:hypothetical protein